MVVSIWLALFGSLDSGNLSCVSFDSFNVIHFLFFRVHFSFPLASCTIICFSICFFYNYQGQHMFLCVLSWLSNSASLSLGTLVIKNNFISISAYASLGTFIVIRCGICFWTFYNYRILHLFWGCFYNYEIQDLFLWGKFFIKFSITLCM